MSRRPARLIKLAEGLCKFRAKGPEAVHSGIVCFQLSECVTENVQVEIGFLFRFWTICRATELTHSADVAVAAFCFFP